MLDVPIENNEDSGSSDSERQCKVGAVDIKLQGDRVVITGAVRFGPQPGAPQVSPIVAKNALSAINSHWSGSFGRFDVLTRMTQGPGGVVILVGSASNASLAGVINITAMPTPFVPLYSEPWGRVVAHEFGHYLGLSTEVEWKTHADGRRAPTFPHRDGGIMAGLAPIAPKLQSHIEKILKSCEPVN
jgi:hypothetical protein